MNGKVSSLLVVSLIAAFGCRRAPEPEGDKSQPASSRAVASSAKAGVRNSALVPTAELPPVDSAVLRHAPPSDDPLRGRFTLQEATAGLPEAGSLYAVMHTTKGKLVCELWPDKAPNTVANFVGLARGLRLFQKNGEWVRAPLYDGSEIYSVLKSFAFEGGSATDRYNERIGYFIPDENWPGAHHDQRGLLCMRGFTPDKNGSQFMILDGATPQLDGSNTIFGRCGPKAVLDAISNVPLVGGRPKQRLTLSKVEIVRSKAPPQ